ncbi:hypothetical protein DFH94DRAFT_354577 [Russula ochroleuca]|uniref:Uncharacterized protein n=1 Tax=Russula ochroleuca TaxID=152965 RepID=A0A9P5MPR0_9AGAM|nr:hypothetical protein DFH94DRAFT_354577 [Russula ochroleuca]
MSRQPPPPPPPSFPQPFGTPWSANPSQNAAGGSAYGQAGPPQGHTHPSQTYGPGVPPSQLYSSQQPPGPTSHPTRRSTHPTGPTYGHTTSYPSGPAPTSTSGSASHYPSYPDSARYATNSSSMSPHMIQRTVSMPMPTHQHTTQSMHHDGSPPNMMHRPSHSEMSGWPQPTSQGWGHPDVNEGEGDLSDYSGGEFEQSPGTSHLQKKSPPNHPFSSRKKSRESLTFYNIGRMLTSNQNAVCPQRASAQAKAQATALRVGRQYPTDFPVDFVEG